MLELLHNTLSTILRMGPFHTTGLHAITGVLSATEARTIQSTSTHMDCSQLLSSCRESRCGDWSHPLKIIFRPINGRSLKRMCSPRQAYPCAMYVESMFFWLLAVACGCYISMIWKPRRLMIHLEFFHQTCRTKYLHLSLPLQLGVIFTAMTPCLPLS